MARVQNRPNFSLSRVDVPEVGAVFLDFADRQMRQNQIGLDNAMQQAKMDEDRRRYETELGFKQRQEQRAVDEINRAEAKAAEEQRRYEADLGFKQRQENRTVDEINRLRNKEAEEERRFKEAADLFNKVGTTYTEVGESNADTIENIKQANEKIGKLQQAYGDAYVAEYWKQPNARPEEIDARARKAVNISNTTSPIGNVIPLARVPEYYEKTKVSQKTADQYTRDLFNEAKKKNILAPNTMQLIDNLTRNYEAALKNNADKAKENMTIDDIKGVIKDFGGDPNFARTKEGGLRYLEALEERMKANKNKDSTAYGAGAASLLAKENTGLSDADWKDIKEAAAKKKISDAELAKLIEASDKPNDIWFTWSSTQKKAVKDMLNNYPDR